MRFGLFFMAEFIEVVVIAGLSTTLFLGGWSIPYLSDGRRRDRPGARAGASRPAS